MKKIAGAFIRLFPKLFPVLVLALGLVYLALLFFLRSYNTSPAGFDLDGYAAQSVQDGGRFKPMDTVARMSLMLISGKQTFIDDKDKRQPAIKWLLDVMTLQDQKGKPRVLDYKVFHIENDQVLSFLGLEPRSGFRYSLTEFKDKLAAVKARVKYINEIDSKKRDLADNKMVELGGHLDLFLALVENLTPRVVIPLGGNKEEWLPLAPFLAEGKVKLLENIPTAALHYGLLRAYANNDPATFNQIVDELPKFAHTDVPSDTATAGIEVFYNQFAAFHYASEFFIYALILGVLSWLGWHRPLSRAAFLLMILAVGLQAFGLLARMYIQHRPLVMVTNLYSSAIFIGFACACICLVIEAIFPMSIALVAGSTVAAATGIIAHNLAQSGDTMEMMQAVLDTNFWLATHVTCVTLGYTATFFAGFLGILYVVLGMFTPLLRKDGANMLGKMIYGIVCFATLLSFTGTVLGGIWADQSWGRFWGWDPKENGALLIVIWNALILHARWGGMVKQRGIAQLAIAGNMVTAWSWFGTNLLGIGLHSYGFMSGAWEILLGFWISQLALIAIAWVPQKYWMSFQKPAIVTLPKPPSGESNFMPPRMPLPKPAT